jgi:superfamily II DNA/RNA helicase
VRLYFWSYSNDYRDYSKITDYLSFDIREEIRPLIEKLADTISLRMLMKTPYPIQSACFPIILSKRDVLILSPSGTGKTVRMCNCHVCIYF